MSGVLLAVAAGVAIAVQVGLIGRAAETRSAIAVAAFVQGAGLLAALTMVLVRGRASDLADTVPLVGFWVPAGIAGTIIVSTMAASASQVGVATAVGVSVAVQLVAGLLWDVRQDIVDRPLQALVGVVLLGAGAWLVATARA